MTWYAVYQAEDGRLVGGTADQTKLAASAILTARGYAVAECPDGAQTGVWNATTHSFAPGSGRDYAWPEEIIAAFTPTQWAAAKALTDARFIWWYDCLIANRTGIDLNSTRFNNGLQLLVSLNVLTAAQAIALKAALQSG